MSSLLGKIGEARDALFVLTGVSYAVGYVVWAVASWNSNLGTLPALDAQYIIAGLFPSILFSLAILLYIKRQWLRHRASPYLFYDRNDVMLTFVMLLVIYPAPLYLPYIIPLHISGFYILATVTWMSIVGPVYAYIKPETYIGKPIQDFITEAIKIGLLILSYVMAITYYIVFLPLIPQQLGGQQPRCALIDLKSDRLSTETLFQFTNVVSGLVIRSEEVQVLFDGSSYLIVRSSRKDVKARGSNNTFEISRDQVTAINWLPQCAAS